MPGSRQGITAQRCRQLRRKWSGGRGDGNSREGRGAVSGSRSGRMLAGGGMRANCHGGGIILRGGGNLGARVWVAINGFMVDLLAVRLEMEVLSAR